MPNWCKQVDLHLLENELKLVGPLDWRYSFVKFEPSKLTEVGEIQSMGCLLVHVDESYHLCCVVDEWQNKHCMFHISCLPLEIKPKTENVEPSATAD